MSVTVASKTTVKGQTSVGGFNPATLFSSGEQGVWYDPSDLSTMYQDSAGTIPVTGLEQPVGRILDKSGRGNHATQSDTTKRPVLSARVNLLTYTEAFDNAAWTKDSISVTPNNTTAPDGTQTADLLTETTTSAVVYLTNNVTTTANVAGRASICVKPNANCTWVRLIYADNTTAVNFIRAWFNVATGTVGSVSYLGTANNATLSISAEANGFYRLTITGINSTGTSTGNLWLNSATADGSNTRNASASYWAWGADLRPANQGVGLPVYQRVGAATYGTSTAAGNADYDANGFPYYLAFDGSTSSRFLATGSVNFGSSDKMTALAGVRKLAAAASYGIVVELSAAASSNSGAFNIAAPGAASGNTENYTFLTNGSAWTGYDAVTFAAPITNVISCAFDNGGATRADEIKPRVNGSIPTLNGGGSPDAGSGNYGNYPLYIGARGGSSFFFNGNIYGLIVRGASSTASQITGAENWLNQRTGAY